MACFSPRAKSLRDIERRATLISALYFPAGLTRAILAEMLGLSASALGSVQVALTGTSDSGTQQPAGR